MIPGMFLVHIQSSKKYKKPNTTFTVSRDVYTFFWNYLTQEILGLNINNKTFPQISDNSKN